MQAPAAWKNSRLFWRKKEGKCEVSFNGVPFTVDEEHILHCQFGDHYFKKKEPKNKQLRMQSTRKIGCLAKVKYKTITLYPEYAIQPETLSSLSEREKKLVQSKLLENLRGKLEKGSECKREQKYFVVLPTVDAHPAHPTGECGAFAQRVHPSISHRISELVAAGITETSEVKRNLKFYVECDLAKELGTRPLHNDRSFYPTLSDIRNHIQPAKRHIELSKLDQEQLRLKVEEWKKTNPSAYYFFRPYIQSGIFDCNQHVPPTSTTSQADSTSEHTPGLFVGDSGSEDVFPIAGSTEKYDQTLLFIHQEEWQKRLLQRYENKITMIDATYKTTRYDIALFFLCVRTNVGYTVVAEFIIQTETAEAIAEALKILKTENPNWNPPTL